jgi:FkbM family methyltransferase
MRIKELIFRSFGFRLQNLSARFKSLDIQKKFGSIIIRRKGSDIRVFKQIFLDEVYFFFPANFNPELIIDAGANVGYSSIWFSLRFPEAKILAIEPEEENFQILNKNINSYKKIIPLKSALWFEETFLKIHNPNAASWAFRTVIGNANESGNVKTITIPALLESYPGKRIDLLKIDIEGAEFELFKNNSEEWLGFVDMIMIETHDNLNSGCTKMIDDILDNHDFSKFITKELSIYIRK